MNRLFLYVTSQAKVRHFLPLSLLRPSPWAFNARPTASTVPLVLWSLVFLLCRHGYFQKPSQLGVTFPDRKSTRKYL